MISRACWSSFASRVATAFGVAVAVGFGVDVSVAVGKGVDVGVGVSVGVDGGVGVEVAFAKNGMAQALFASKTKTRINNAARFTLAFMISS